MSRFVSLTPREKYGFSGCVTRTSRPPIESTSLVSSLFIARVVGGTERELGTGNRERRSLVCAELAVRRHLDSVLRSRFPVAACEKPLEPRLTAIRGALSAGGIRPVFGSTPRLHADRSTSLTLAVTVPAQVLPNSL